MRGPRAEKISLHDFLVWEERQADRYEWIAGTVVQLPGVPDEHAAIQANVTTLLQTTLGSDGPCFVRGSGRKLVPRDATARNLGSFYADIFVSCRQADRTGAAAHYPTLVIEILSRHIGEEFTDKRRAYLALADLQDYLIIDSRKKCVNRFSWIDSENASRRLVSCEYLRGPVFLPSLASSLTFEQIYAGTTIPSIADRISSDEHEIDSLTD